ncbi:hypothetical protein AB1Y20_003523 [Prymnesium parvum]|uniref:Replication factor A C-terminal domain-containing protein n=1 Tax=Prymnesium parvum TaxID=97485 RepID=A0AB34J519_PRYPA
MPDAAVVCCARCGWHQALKQVMPATREYFDCSSCGSTQPVQVVRKDGHALRSYDVVAIQKKAQELNAQATSRRKAACLSHRKVHLLEQMSRQAERRLQQQQQSNERWPGWERIAKEETREREGAEAAEPPQTRSRTNRRVRASSSTAGQDSPEREAAEASAPQQPRSGTNRRAQPSAGGATSQRNEAKPVNEQWIAASYCPVSYFDGDGPNLGADGCTAAFRGTVYKMCSVEAMNKFLEEPENFLPQFGGFCAMSVANGQLVPVDPTHFKIVNNKLYLFSKSPEDNKAAFEANEADILKRAEEKWDAGAFGSR